MMKLAAAVLALSAAGCNLYFGGGDDEPPPPPCDYGAEPGGAYPTQTLRDPYTGECQDFGYPYPCDGTCGPCPAAADAIAVPNWAACYTQCEYLDESSCLVTSGCQAAYETYEGAPDGTRGQGFLGCWATAGYNPGAPANCAALDAETCSQHDTCSMNYLTKYAPDDGADHFFSHCSAEGGSGTVCYSDMDCSPDERCTAGIEECNSPCPEGDGACPAVCAGHCVPRQTSCSNIDCGPGAHCEEQCYAGPNGQMYCEPICVQDASCAAVDCGPGYHCVETCTDPGPMDPASDPSHPECGQCYPQCVPDNQPPICEELDEMSCYSRSDCTPVYEGQDCTCYPDGCQCNILTYDRCQSNGGGGGGSTPPGM